MRFLAALLSLSVTAQASFFDDGATPAPSPSVVLRLSGAPQPTTLADKARLMEERTQSRHLPWFGLVLSIWKDERGERYEDFDDSAIWTGLYVAAEAYQYEATKDAAALARMENSLRGLHALAQVTGTPGLIARSIAPWYYVLAHPESARAHWHPASGPYEGYGWKGHLSNDQYDGWLFGVAAAWPWIQDADLRTALREDARAMAEHVIAHDLKIIGPDTHLDFSPGYYYQDRWPGLLRGMGVGLPPIRACNPMHGLHLMKVCAWITGEERFERYYEERMIGRLRYDETIERYGPAFTEEAYQELEGPLDYVARLRLGDDARFKARDMSTPVGVNLDHLAYHDLARLERDPRLAALYAGALAESHAPVADQANAFWDLIQASHAPDFGLREELLDILGRFPSEPVFPTQDNSADPTIPKRKTLNNGYTRPLLGGGTRWTAQTPLPLEKRVLGPQFAWQHDPYQLDGGSGREEGSGTAYLIAYWLGRALGYLGPGD